MPKLKLNKSVKELMDQIKEWKQTIPEFNKLLGKYENVIGAPIQNTVQTIGGEPMDYVQYKNKSFKEILGVKKSDKAPLTEDMQITIMAAQAALMEMNGNTSTFQMTSVEGGKMIQEPVIQEDHDFFYAENEKTVNPKVALSMWDRFWKCLGVVTENYKQYQINQEVSKKLADNLIKDFQQSNLDIGSELVQQYDATDIGIKNVKPWNQEISKLLFGQDKEVDDWVLPNGAKLSATAVAMGVLAGKEVKAEGVWELLQQDPESGIESLKEQLGDNLKKAQDICQDLLRKRETYLKSGLRKLDENLFNKRLDAISEEMEKTLKEAITPATDVSPKLSQSEQLDSVTPDSTDFAARIPAMNAKRELCMGLNIKEYKSTLTDEVDLAKATHSRTAVNLARALNTRDYSKIKELTGKALKTELYLNALSNIQTARMRAEHLGMETQPLSTEEFDAIKQGINHNLEEAGILKETDPRELVINARKILTHHIKDFMRLSVDLDIHGKLEGTHWEMTTHPMSYYGKDDLGIGGSIMKNEKMQEKMAFEIEEEDVEMEDSMENEEDEMSFGDD